MYEIKVSAGFDDAKARQFLERIWEKLRGRLLITSVHEGKEVTVKGKVEEEEIPEFGKKVVRCSLKVTPKEALVRWTRGAQFSFKGIRLPEGVAVFEIIDGEEHVIVKLTVD